MKKFLLGLLALMAGAAVSSAQDHEPTTTWPYLYPDFMEGELHMPGGVNKSGLYNVCIAQGTLHFIDGPLVKEALSSEVFSVRIGEDCHANVGGRIMRVLAKSDNGFVAEDLSIDVASLNATGGAYGSSSNSVSTRALSSLEGIGGTSANMNHMDLKNSKNDGKVLPLIKKTYLVLPNRIIYATKKDVLAAEGVDKARTNAFLKENKIKWKDPQSLILLVDYLSEMK